MVLCPVCLAVGCRKCFLVKICPLKRVIGDFPKKIVEPETIKKTKTDQNDSQ